MKLIQDEKLGKINVRDKAQRMLSGYAKFWCAFLVVFFLVVILLNIVKTQVQHPSEIMEPADSIPTEMIDSN